MAIQGDTVDDNFAFCPTCGEMIFGDDEDSAVCPYCCGYYDATNDSGSHYTLERLERMVKKEPDLY